MNPYKSPGVMPRRRLISRATWALAIATAFAGFCHLIDGTVDLALPLVLDRDTSDQPPMVALVGEQSTSEDRDGRQEAEQGDQKSEGIQAGHDHLWAQRRIVELETENKDLRQERNAALSHLHTQNRLDELTKEIAELKNQRAEAMAAFATMSIQLNTARSNNAALTREVAELRSKLEHVQLAADSESDQLETQLIAWQNHARQLQYELDVQKEDMATIKARLEEFDNSNMYPRMKWLHADQHGSHWHYFQILRVNHSGFRLVRDQHPINRKFFVLDPNGNEFFKGQYADVIHVWDSFTQKPNNAIHATSVDHS